MALLPPPSLAVPSWLQSHAVPHCRSVLGHFLHLSSTSIPGCSALTPFTVPCCPLHSPCQPSTLPQCTSCPLLSPRLLSCPLSPLLHLRVPLIVPSPCLPPPPRGLPWPRGTSAPLPSRGWKQGCSQPSEENSVSSGLGSSHRSSPARNIPSGDGGCCRRPAGPTQTLRTRHCPFKQPAALIG